MQKAIAEDIAAHPVVLYMKGTPEAPMCGFSSVVCAILKALYVPFVSRNVLEDPLLRSEIKVFSNWPTVPQLYVDGTLIGGCDIVRDLYDKGELKTLFANRSASPKA